MRAGLSQDRRWHPSHKHPRDGEWSCRLPANAEGLLSLQDGHLLALDSFHRPLWQRLGPLSGAHSAPSFATDLRKLNLARTTARRGCSCGSSWLMQRIATLSGANESSSSRLNFEKKKNGVPCIWRLVLTVSKFVCTAGHFTYLKNRYLFLFIADGINNVAYLLHRRTDHTNTTNKHQPATKQITWYSIDTEQDAPIMQITRPTNSAPGGT